jgi:hypothetical protein
LEEASDAYGGGAGLFGAVLPPAVAAAGFGGEGWGFLPLDALPRVLEELAAAGSLPDEQVGGTC